MGIQFVQMFFQLILSDRLGNRYFNKQRTETSYVFYFLCFWSRN